MDTILIVDDERNYLLVLEALLSDHGYQVLTAESGREALQVCASHELELVITDMKMPGMDGMAVLEAIHAGHPELPVVMMTAFGTVEKAVEGMKKGAFDYILKPFKNEELIFTIRKAIDHYKLIRRNRELTQQLQERYHFDQIVGKSAAMQRIYQLIEKVAPSRATVLISGESGTGKELIARSIHFNSLRRDQPFISVNCGALPETLLESELFGHERGAFSGAVSQRKGRFELAHQGTLFLDEVSEMSPHLQVKLLRILQEMEFERVGGSTTLRVDVRVVAASNRDLKEEVTKGHFRADLFYRLNVVQFHLPPLRERRDDIPLLVNHFLAKYAKESHLTSLAVTPEAMRHLLDYPWPGNVRQLENVIERAVILCGGEHITERDLAPEIRAPAQLPPEGAAHGAFGEPFAGRSTESVGPAPDSRVEWQPQDSSQRQQRALGFIRSHGFITNKYYSGMNGISERQALRELSEMVDRGVLLRTGKGRSCRYVLPRELA